MSSRFVWILVTICLVIALCLPASAGFNKASAYHSLQESTGYQNMPQSPGNLTLHGQWKYYDRDGSSVPAKRFLVWLYTATNPIQWLGHGYTNDAGTYVIGPFPNPGVEIKVRICTFYYPLINSEITVAPPGSSSGGGVDAHFYSPPGNGYGPYADVDGIVPLLTVPTSNTNLAAWWIKDDLDDGFQFLPDKIGNYFALWQNGWYIPWPWPQGNSAFFSNSTCEQIKPFNPPDPPCKKAEALHLSSSDRDTVLHEMGHAVMYFAYDHYLPTDLPWQGLQYYLFCRNHDVNVTTTDKCAWVEGWAEFWSFAVQHPNTNDYIGTMESQNWMYPEWPTGDDCEGRVCGTLWDLYDYRDDGFDKYSLGKNYIWDTLYKSGVRHNSFAEFYDTWWKPPLSHSKPAITACAYQNTIFYDDGPPLPEAVDSINSGLNWTTGGNAKWFGEIYESYDGVDAAQSGYVGTNGFAWIQTSVNGPGTLYFWWKNSGHNLDELTFYKDNIEQSSHLHGGSSWQQGVYNVSSSGTHTFKWQYKEVYDWVGEGNQACGYLDRVEWIPANNTQKLIGADLNSGYTGVASGGYFALAQFTAEASGTITELRVRCASGGNIKLAIYSDISGEPGNLISGAFTDSTYVDAGWNTIPFPSTTVTAGQKYWLARNSDGSMLYWKAQPGSPFRARAAAFSGFSFPSSAGTLPISEQLYHLVAGWGTITPIPPTAPTVTNASGATLVTSTTARLNGEVTNTGNENPTVTIYWGTTDGGTTPGNWTNNVNLGIKGLGTFYTDISSLNPNTDYYYRCYATNSAGSDWADATYHFKTPVLAQKLIGADAGSSYTGTASGGYFALAQFTAEASGTITELRVRCASSGNIKLAIYSDNNGEPGNLLSGAFTNSTPVVAGWNTIPFPTTTVTAGTKYWLARNSDGSMLYWKASTGVQFRYRAAAFSTFTFPTTATALGALNIEPNTYHLVAGWGTIIITPLDITTTSLPNGNIGTTYSQTLQATGGTTPYTWALTAGALPAGLTLATNGVISGIPTTAGTPGFTVQVTDAASNTDTQALTITITLQTQKLIGADAGSSYTATASGGYFALAQFTAEASGTITELRCRCASGGNIKLAIYSDNNGEPGTLLNAVNTSTPVVAGWNTITFPTTAITAGQKYWLARNSDGNMLYWKAQPGSPFRYRAAAFSGFSFPSSAGTGFGSDELYNLTAGWGIPSETTQKLIGAASDSTYTNVATGGYFALAQFTAEASGTITELRVKCASSGNIKLAIYSDISGEPGNLLPNAFTNSTHVDAGWNTIPFPSTSITTGQKYWLARNSDGNMLYWKASSGAQFRYIAAAFSTFTFPATATALGALNIEPNTYHLVAGWGTAGP